MLPFPPPPQHPVAIPPPIHSKLPAGWTCVTSPLWSWWGSHRTRWDASGSTSSPLASLRSSGKGGPSLTLVVDKPTQLQPVVLEGLVQCGAPPLSLNAASPDLRKRWEPTPPGNTSLVGRGGQAQPSMHPTPALIPAPLAPNQAVPASHPLPLQCGAAGQRGHGPGALHHPREPRRALCVHRHLPAERAGGGAAGAERGPLRVRQRWDPLGHLPSCFPCRPLQKRSWVPGSCREGEPRAGCSGTEHGWGHVL